ncbi:MAG: hypothetical protein R3F61_13760 [Myxococcota bacterium]
MAVMDRVPRSHLWASTALVAVAVGVSWWTHTGPWRWLTELQLVWLDAWYPEVNAVFLLALGLAVLLPPLAILHRESPAQPQPDLTWWKDGPGRWVLVGIVVSVMALFSALQGLMAGERVELSIDALAESHAQYVRIPLSGADPGFAMGLDDDWYVPLLRERRVVAVGVVRVLDGAPGLAELGDGSGMRATFGLPGPVLSSWQQAGLEVDRGVPVVELGTSPGEKLALGACVGSMGLPFFVPALVSQRRWVS